MEIVEWIRHWDVLERYLVPRRLHLYELRRKEPLYNPRWPPRRRGLLLANTRQEAPPWFTARDGMIYWDFLFHCFRSLIHLARTSLDSARADVNERGNNGELKEEEEEKKKKKKKQENKRCGLGVSGPREFLGGVYELKIRLKKGETRTDDKGRMLKIARGWKEDGGQNLWALYHFTGLAASPLAVRRAGSHDELWHSTRSTLDE
ncbi:hypothetical protein V1478_004020, partial [Vespula squamosa]